MALGKAVQGRKTHFCLLTDVSRGQIEVLAPVRIVTVAMECQRQVISISPPTFEMQDKY